MSAQLLDFSHPMFYLSANLVGSDDHFSLPAISWFEPLSSLHLLPISQ